jgi:glycine betaine/proline transport system permease protein
MNQWLENFILNWSEIIGALKTFAFFYIMLPVRVGLVDTISPYSWGFEFTTALRIGYGLAIVLLAAWNAWRGRVTLALAILFFGILIYFGLTKLSWLVLLMMAGALGYQLGGYKLGLGAVAALGFIVLTGIWPQAMLSVYLCGIAVVISFLVGGTIGIMASEIDLVSRIVRPINDTLQTMPLFVILIPFVMIFKIGEFSALLAVVAYAIVPAIRYTEHGLRNLPADVIEASTCMGCTRWQLLIQVKLPLALPVIMLGLNQTIMYAIAMLVIAALVGTNGLGQQVYIGLGDGDFGVGIIAGIGMAIIAIVADRFTQSWSAARQAAFS